MCFGHFGCSPACLNDFLLDSRRSFIYSCVVNFIPRLISDTFVTQQTHGSPGGVVAFGRYGQSWGISAGVLQRHRIFTWIPRSPLSNSTMDIEEQTGLLTSTPEYLETVKVFPLIPHIRKDATVRAVMSLEVLEMVLNPSARNP